MKRFLAGWIKSVAIGMAVSVVWVSGAFAASAPPAKNQEATVTNIETRGAVRVDRITSKSDQSAQNTFIVTLPVSQLQPPANLVEPSQQIPTVKLNRLTVKEQIDSLEKDLLKEQSKSTGRVYFALFGTQAEAQAFAKNVAANSGVSPMARGRFGFGSYVETYGGLTGGWHVYFSSRDANYVFNLGGVAAGAVAAWLANAAAMSGGTAILVGAISAAAVLTLYWREQNTDGSLDIRVPYLSLTMVPPLRPVKVGQHWYAF